MAVKMSVTRKSALDDIKVGDRVRYSVKWLRSTGNYAGDIPHAKGVVTAIEPLSSTSSLAVVDWGNPGIPPKVLTSNLTVVGSPKERYESVASVGDKDMDLNKRAEEIVQRAQYHVAKHKQAESPSMGVYDTGLKRYPEFKPLVDQIVRAVVTQINADARKIKSKMPYKAQFVLEEVIRELEERV